MHRNISTSGDDRHRGCIEPLEQRIAPAALAITRQVAAVVGAPIQLHAGDVLSTSQAGGAYLLFVEKGNAVVYTTDLNNNQQVDFNEITGISAGDGLRLISFVDIHGDIVTNLRPDGTRLTDSDNDASNGLDGRALENSQIEKIELRSLTQADLPVGTDVLDRLALSTYSIFGNIYAGRGFGATDGGLIIDTIGSASQATKFAGTTGVSLFVSNVVPSIGSIKVGSAASGELFSFGTSPAGRGAGFHGEDVQGELQPFLVPFGQDGADILGVHIADGLTKFNLGTLKAGDGGFNGRGGNVANVQITGDFAGGYSIIAGNAGIGTVGKAGGSILNFSDIGSITSQVVLQTGNGGRGQLGAGGPGGNIEFTPSVNISIAARLLVNLGKGGDGLTAGGNGASLQSGVFVTPEGEIPFALSTASSSHEPGDIFNTIVNKDADGNVLTDPTDPTAKYHAIRSFDFDLDGTNDIVYTSKNPDQLVVLFGFPGGGLDIQGTRYPGALGSLYLNAPANPEALVVADLNGDGLPDIAAASQNDSTAGVSVYLSQYARDPSDPTATPKLIGFRDPIFSPLPHVADYFDNLGNSYYQSAFKITNLVAGDFDGDGVTDLGVATQLKVIRVVADNAVIFIMRGDSHPVNGPGGTGYFYADFVNAGPLGLPYDDGFTGRLPTLYTGLVQLKASALTDGGDDPATTDVKETRDFLVASVTDVKFLSVYDYGTHDASTPIPVPLGKVDINRDVSDPTKRDKIALVDATVKDFTILDLDDNGMADIAVLTNVPSAYMVTVQGNGLAAGFVVASNDPSDDTQGRDNENAGLPLAEDPPKGLGIPDSLVGILTTATNGTMAAPQTDGKGNDVAVVDYNNDSGHNFGFKEISFTNFFTITRQDTDGSLGSAIPLTEEVLAFDTYRPDEATLDGVGYAFGHAVKGRADFDIENTSVGAGGFFVPLANNGYFIHAGDGGDSATGKGGIGGQIGNKLVSTGGVTTGTLSIQLPAQVAFAPVVRFIAGTGGDGLTGGGLGGDLRGLTLTSLAAPLTSSALLFAGDGGNSVKGTGGNGGNLDALSIVTGEVFIAGDGGRGVIGGLGGSVLGNKIAGLPNTSNSQTNNLAVEGGRGGLGLKHGGDGGSILNFTPDFLPVTGATPLGFSLLHYRGGTGGNSLSGPGGRGGSVVNGSPVGAQNNVLSDIELLGGRGGDGLTGGGGGSVTDFQNSPGQGSVPKSVSVIAGFGGIGSGGKGGVGGDVRNLNITATGVGSQWVLDFSQPDKTEFFPGLPQLPILFGRYIAGEGGASFGSTGAAGGSVDSVVGIAASASFAVAAGKGGDGLRGGAAGGNVSGTVSPTLINAAALLGKVLIIAGDGGDVFGALATPSDPLAFGGISGSGGNGGSISNISQPGSQTTVVDLIAGNGGNTINFGSSLDSTTKAGRGGSIRDVHISGDIGNVKNDDPRTTDVNETVPIKAYNDISAGELVSDFVRNTLIGSAFVALDDTLGNVGLVAGATGRVRDNNGDGILDPSSVGINGSVINVSATNIMSAVAGSVDRIASIQIISQLTVPFEGAIGGADKAAPDPATFGKLDYLDQDGNLVSSPVLGGRLLDGAIIGKNDYGNSPDGTVVRKQLGVRDFIRR